MATSIGHADTLDEIPTLHNVVFPSSYIYLLSANAFRLDISEICCLSFPSALVSTGLQYEPLENTVGKGEIARYEQFLLFPQCFVAVSVIFIQLKVVVCKLFQFGRV